MQDITERKQLQASVAQSDRLASMGMLAAGVGHEINNPLAYVLYNVESLVEELPKILLRPSMLDGVVDLAREALEGILRIKNVARDLSTFSRVESAVLSRVDLKHAIDAPTIGQIWPPRAIVPAKSGATKEAEPCRSSSSFR